MIRTGQIIENPVTGESLRFLKTSRDTNGESVVVEVTVRPDGFVAAAHMHPEQSEHFQILEGLVGFRLGREKMELQAGESVLVEPGTAHKFWNAGDTPARFVTVVRPALQFEQLIETMYGLAADGKTNKKGMPNPLRLAVIAKEHFDDVRLPFPPVALQRAGLALGAPIGRMLGYTPTYAPAASLGGIATAEA
jgi:quercetin dioxygenase-like cupin family protein